MRAPAAAAADAPMLMMSTVDDSTSVWKRDVGGNGWLVICTTPQQKQPQKDERRWIWKSFSRTVIDAVATPVTRRRRALFTRFMNTGSAANDGTHEITATMTHQRRKQATRFSPWNDVVLMSSSACGFRLSAGGRSTNSAP